MKIHLLRHGKTEDHDKRKRQSPTSDLGSIGIKQAELVASRLTTEPIDALIASPWTRTRTTAKIVSQKTGHDIILDDLIHEQENNPILNNLSYDHPLTKAYLQDAFQAGRNNIDWKFQAEGESMREVLNRARRFKQFLLTNYIGKSILVVGHGAFFSLFISTFLHEYNAPDELIVTTSYPLRVQENTALSLLHLDTARNEWRLKYFNDYSHLSNPNT